MRGLALVGVAHLVMHAAAPDDRIPVGYRGAMTYPFVSTVAKTIQTLLPHGGRAADRLAPAIGGAVTRGVADTPQTDDIGASAEPAGDRAGER